MEVEHNAGGLGHNPAAQLHVAAQLQTQSRRVAVSNELCRLDQRPTRNHPPVARAGLEMHENLSLVRGLYSKRDWMVCLNDDAGEAGM
jgi:hypothetical protein